MKTKIFSNGMNKTCIICRCSCETQLFYDRYNKVVRTCLFCREKQKMYRNSKGKQTNGIDIIEISNVPNVDIE